MDRERQSKGGGSLDLAATAVNGPGSGQGTTVGYSRENREIAPEPASRNVASRRNDRPVRDCDNGDATERSCGRGGTVAGCSLSLKLKDRQRGHVGPCTHVGL